MGGQVWRHTPSAASAALPRRSPPASSRVPNHCSLPLLSDEQARLHELQKHLDQSPLPQDSPMCVRLLQTCGELKALTEGKRLHDHIRSSGLQRVTVVANSLITMYGKCASVDDSRRIFDSMTHRNVVSWNAMIAAHIQNGDSKEALLLFKCMQLGGVKPNKVTFVTVLSACACRTNLDEGKWIHSCVVDCGLEGDVAVGSALVNMYSKCGSVNHGRKAFDGLHNQDIVSWNGLITMYVQHGYAKEALQIFEDMERRGIKPNKVTFIVVLNACANPISLLTSKIIHGKIANVGFERDITVLNALINMYGKCASPKEARNIFDKMPECNVVSWNIMISIYAEQGYCEEAVQLFQQMQLAGMKVNGITYVNILSAFNSPAAVTEGKAIHASAVDNKLESEVTVGNALLCMYSRCGRVEDARRMFEKIQDRSVVSWNAIISAYDCHGHGQEAFELFQQMQEEGLKPNEFTFASIISACASIAALQEGKMIHAFANDSGFGSDEVVRSALVNMYGKCGSVEDAWGVFKTMPKRSMITWTALIAAYAQHGISNKALHLFYQMQDEGLKPNEISFVSIISACSHAGLVDEGCYFFFSISQENGITPMATHYCCLIDLYGRAGMLDTAEDIIDKMPLQPGSTEWLTLLGACRNYGDVERGERAAQHVLDLCPQHSAAFISLANIYASACMWVD